jgi:16S rRNA (adenine1518-N6/adenine1519-N6)-dimethyltransferase
LNGVSVLEIGPGPGGLTRAILDAGALNVVAVEADGRFAENLRGWEEAASGRLSVIHADALRVDIPGCLAEHGCRLPVTIIANLPYNVGTPLLVTWLKARGWRGDMVLMFQKEVALRICAEPGDAHYGRLSVLTAATCRPAMIMTLPPGAFRPPPRVDSAVVLLRPLPETERFEDLDALEAISAAAFGQRRKMLRVALRSLGIDAGQAEALLAETGIDPTRRAETLSQSDFRRLASAFRIHQGREPSKDPV